MSQIVTPPDIIDQYTVYLIVNAHQWDIEIMVKWLQLSREKYTVHLYNDQMNKLDWLHQVSKISKTIIVDRHETDLSTIEKLLDQIDKIKWFGKDQTYTSATSYLIKHG